MNKIKIINYVFILSFLLILSNICCKKSTSSGTNVISNNNIMPYSQIFQNKNQSSDDSLNVNNQKSNITPLIPDSMYHDKNDSFGSILASPMQDEYNAEAGEGTVIHLKRGPSGFKVLQVTKITSNGDNKLTRNDIKRYINSCIYNNDTLKDKDSCIKAIAKRLESKIWLFKNGPEYNQVETKGFPNKENRINYYFVKTHGAKVDSFIFVEHGWSCPDYKSFYLFPDIYVGINYKGRFNYIGNNQGFAKNGLALKPFFNNRYTDTVFTPVIVADDSSSIMINSDSGFEIKYQQLNSLQPTQQEIKIILESILAGNTHISCFDTIAMEKLAILDGISRFAGLIKTSSCYDGCFNSKCFVADIKDDHCFLTLHQFNPAYFSPAFYCAYTFGEGNLPDVFVWSITNERDVVLREIYYISDRCWAYTETSSEYTGDCFEEESE